MSESPLKKQKTMSTIMNSWVSYDEESHFPIQNLPYGVFAAKGAETDHIGVAIGNQVLDLHWAAGAGLLKGKHIGDGKVFQQTVLNDFMALGKAAWSETRALLTDLFKEGGNAALKDHTELSSGLLNQSDVEMRLPARIGDYTDFYSSRYHATNLGTMFRGPDNALQPNWTWIPIGYHGRASSVVVSGTDIRRPNGQLRPDVTKDPVYDTCKLMDIELEVGFFVGPGNELGTPITMENAHEHIFGMTICNDWSARDIQKWEYIPLGPFGGKNLGTSISPWIVTMEALEDFRIVNQKQEPPCLPYLNEVVDKDLTCYDINLEVTLQSDKMDEPMTISNSNTKYLYWNFKQQLVQHSVTGCNMRPGDFLASGTISGPTNKEYGSMIEICWKGTKPLDLPDNTQRKFLKDHDTVNMTGFAQGKGYRVGFGDCKGKIIPANPNPYKK